MKTDLIIGTHNLAKELMISRETVYRYCNEGMPFIQINNRRRGYELKKIEQWLKKNN